MNGLQFIFVHGLSGWGSYDKVYRRIPYWGMRGGDLMAFLREKGFDCYAASVAPTGSAWDRKPTARDEGAFSILARSPGMFAIFSQASEFPRPLREGTGIISEDTDE